MQSEPLKIFKYGEKVLQTPAIPVENINGELVELSKKMVFTMHQAPGVGLAAPQVGYSLALITVDPSGGEKPNDLLILINPRIVERNGHFSSEEGCLSFPGIFVPIERSFEILVKAINIDGKEIEFEARDYLARIIQHEIDHLNATLIIDHLSPLKRTLIKSEIKKLKKSGQW